MRVFLVLGGIILVDFFGIRYIKKVLIYWFWGRMLFLGVRGLFGNFLIIFDGKSLVFVNIWS